MFVVEILSCGRRQILTCNNEEEIKECISSLILEARGMNMTPFAAIIRIYGAITDQLLLIVTDENAIIINKGNVINIDRPMCS